MAALGVLIAAGSLAVSTAQAVSITTLEGVALNQSATDALQGIAPTVNANVSNGVTSGTTSDFTSAYTNATAPNAPTSGVFFSDGNGRTITFDLGTGVAAADRQLDGFDVWFSAGLYRSGFAGSLSLSLDGVTWTPINGATINFVPTARHAYGLSDYASEVAFSFGAGEVSNFRYIQLTVNNAVDADGVARQANIMETDAFVSTVPEPSTFALMALPMAALAVTRLARRKRAEGAVQQ